jgi:hypothetical protein
LIPNDIAALSEKNEKRKKKEAKSHCGKKESC